MDQKTRLAALTARLIAAERIATGLRSTSAKVGVAYLLGQLAGISRVLRATPRGFKWIFNNTVCTFEKEVDTALDGFYKGMSRG